MSEMMLAHTNPAANQAQTKQTAPKAVTEGRNTNEISESSRSFSNTLKNHVDGSGASKAEGDTLKGDAALPAEVAEVAPDLAADGKGLPAELLEELPEELINLLDSLPEDVMDQIVQQFNEWATPQMAIPAQQKILVREIQSVLKHLPDMSRPVVDALKLLPEGLKVAEQQVSDQGGKQLDQLKQFFTEARDDITGKTRSAFQELAAQLTRSTTTSATPSGSERPVLPDSALAALNALQSEATQTQATQRATPTSTQLHVPFQQAGWDNALSERIVWMANQKLQSAEIKMNPPHLGPIEVRLNISGDQAQVQFTAHHGVVREALESALPRLREMFGANGLNLADVNVSDQSGAEKRHSADGSEEGQKQHGFADAVQDTEERDESLSGVSLLNSSTPMGAIDYFV